MQQLLWIETLLKFIPGLLLVIAPLTTLRVLGLHRPDAGFWPRLCGALLLGMAAAIFIEGTAKGHGLGMAGVIVINLTGAAVLSSLLILEAGPKSRRGTIAVWLTVCALVLLSITEIATI